MCAQAVSHCATHPEAEDVVDADFYDPEQADDDDDDASGEARRETRKENQRDKKRSS
jgi:hypothetical protein